MQRCPSVNATASRRIRHFLVSHNEPKSRLTGASKRCVRHYNFASNAYAGCLGNLCHTDREALKTAALDYLKNSTDTAPDGAWYSDPVQTVLGGEVLQDGECTEAPTVDAFNVKNGALVNASDAIVERVIQHMLTYRPPTVDLRTPFREIEQQLLSPAFAGKLIGTQAQDFHKQDGITEIEEAVEANTVERRMNDLVIADEAAGKITINRAPALIGCVSNFSIFLDLFRKTVRSLELGIPVVVLSRSNTGQHTYRWFQMLQKLMEEKGIDAGMITHVACNVEQQRRIMFENPESPLHFTGSREVAAKIKEVCPKLQASTGGPNTMVMESWSDAAGEAMAWSASIESAGQCTALRHVVGPISSINVEKAFAKTPILSDSQQALGEGQFAGIFKSRKALSGPGYTQHPDGIPMAYTIRDNELPPLDIQEHWREVVVDVTNISAEDLQNNEFKDKVAQWLVHQQPISLAVNGDTFQSAFELANYLWERTSMVVNTVGSKEQPALTCQARPQESEIFGEFPPRHELTKYTQYPVVGPSSTPSYNAFYTPKCLSEAADRGCPPNMTYCKDLLEAVSPAAKGYLVLLMEYLQEAAVAGGGRPSFGIRSNMWGLQRPPLNGSTTTLEINAFTTPDALAVTLLPFLITNAREQVSISFAEGVDAASHPATAVLNALPQAMRPPTDSTDLKWNSISPLAYSENSYPMVGQFVSLLFPLGHIKCTRANDQAFIDYFSKSRKWLRVHS